jgi:hypothetical protein
VKAQNSFDYKKRIKKSRIFIFGNWFFKNLAPKIYGRGKEGVRVIILTLRKIFMKFTKTLLSKWVFFGFESTEKK